MHYILIVDPAREQRAVQRLRDMGHDAYSPRIWKRIRHRNRLADTARPMFPCYAFIRAPVPFAAVEAVNGVWRFLTVDQQQPAQISQKAIEAIRAREEQLERLFRARKGPTGSFEPGQPVLVKVGQFADMLARVDRVDERGRVEILIAMLGAERRAAVRHHEIIAA